MTYKQEWLAVAKKEIVRLRKLLKLALVLLLLVFPLKAQAPITYTFTISQPPILTTPPDPEQSYYTYNMLTFDGTPYGSGFNEIDRLADYLGAPETFDFNFPTLTLTGCNLSSKTVSPLNFNGPTYQTQTTVTNIACESASTQSYSVQTIQNINYKKVWCRFRACFTPLSYPPITGTVTAQ